MVSDGQPVAVVCLNADIWLQRWLGQWCKAVLSKVGLPEIALDSVVVRDGQVSMWVAGESIPRQFEQADYTVALGRDYQDLDFTLSGMSAVVVSWSVMRLLWSV